MEVVDGGVVIIASAHLLEQVAYSVSGFFVGMGATLLYLRLRGYRIVKDA